MTRTGDDLPPKSDPERAKAKPPAQRRALTAPATEIERAPAEVIEDQAFLEAAPEAIAAYGNAIARGVVGSDYEAAPLLAAFGSKLAEGGPLWVHSQHEGNSRLAGDVLNAAKAIYEGAAEAKRLPVCILSLSLVYPEVARQLTPEEQQWRRSGHHGAESLSRAMTTARRIEDDETGLDDVMEFLSNPMLKPRCLILADLAIVGRQFPVVLPRAASRQRWFVVGAWSARALMRSVRADPAGEFHLQLTSFPKKWDPHPVDGETRQRLFAALSAGLEGATMPAADVSLAEASGPEDGVALARSVWQSLRAEMKSILEARIEELSKQTFETYEQKAAVADELRRAMDEWAFRAVAPASGLPAFLRCRLQSDHPRGQFYFQEISGTAPVADPVVGAKRASSQVPSFRLTDRPLDRREAQATTEKK